VIRQAISCDICGAEKKQTNHWFVAWELAGELRVSGWNSRNRQRTGAKHLCGQVCMHKLADDFMARVIAQKIGSKAPADEMEAEPDAMLSNGLSAQVSQLAAARMAAAAHPTSARGLGTDTSLTATAGHVELESSSRLLSPAPDALRPEPRVAAGLVTMRERLHADSLPLPPALPVLPVEPAQVAIHNRRAEAWQRERERTQRAGEPRPEIVTRRIAGNGD
jgi:hypothetical protein